VTISAALKNVRLELRDPDLVGAWDICNILEII
jgi:hypothetical protein